MDTQDSSRRELFILVFGSSDFSPEAVINGVPAADFLRSTVTNLIQCNLSLYSSSIIAEAFEVQDALMLEWFLHRRRPPRAIISENRASLWYSLSHTAYKKYEKKKKSIVQSLFDFSSSVWKFKLLKSNNFFFFFFLLKILQKFLKKF